jgi:phosphoribosyl 1,2-cyclic phosphodiesterase
VSVQFTILGSGSSGNCAYLETDDARLLVDAGLSARQIRQRLLGIGKSPESLSGILVTHEHTDHTQGLAVLAARLNIPVYCNRLTREAIELQFPEVHFDFRLFSTGSSFELGDVTVDTFSVPHDAYDPVGFLIRTSAGNVGVLTDLGHATKLVIERVRGAQILVLEANHDVKMLHDDIKRPWATKQRILSRHGHLSNDAAAQVAADILSAELQHLLLGHLSTDCNSPDLAHRVVAARLTDLGGTHVNVLAASPSVPGPTLTLGSQTPQGGSPNPVAPTAAP